jgi:hypothetical protein
MSPAPRSVNSIAFTSFALCLIVAAQECRSETGTVLVTQLGIFNLLGTTQINLRVTRPGVMCQGSSVCHDASMADVAPGPESTPSQRWLARLSFVLAGAAIVIVVVVAGLKSLAMLAVGLAAALVSLATAYVFLSRRGLWRWLSLAVVVMSPIAVVVVYAFRDLLWVAVLSAALWLLAGITAWLALAGNQMDWRMPERPAQPSARHPYLIMNPKSGGGQPRRADPSAGEPHRRSAEDLEAVAHGPEVLQPLV